MSYTPDELLADAQVPGGLDMPLVRDGLEVFVGRCVARTLARVRPDVRWEIEATAFTELVLAIPRYDPARGTPEAFMNAVVRNAALAHWRGRNAGFRGMVPLDEVAEELGRQSRAEHPDPEELNRDRLKLLILYEIANPVQKRMMNYFKRGWSRNKVAEKLGVPRNRVDQWVCRLRRRTLKILETKPSLRD